MSGVFGLLDAHDVEPVAPLVKRMAASLTHRPWFGIDTYVERGGAATLGRVGIGIFNREPQPRCSDDGDTVVFLSGVLWNAAEIRRELEQSGPALGDGSDAELVLRLFAQRGSDFVSCLEGEFIIAIWSRARAELLLASDRLGMYPTYYAHRRGRFLFAPELKAILAAAGEDPALDRTALAQYMRFQRLLGDRTFFEGVKMLPAGAVLQFDLRRDAATLRRYWSFADIPPVPSVTFGEAVEECDRLIEIAANRLPSRWRTALYLSGGLDSRLLLATLSATRAPLTAITYGRRRSRDVVYAQRLARTAGVAHRWFPMEDGRWVAEHADFHLEVTEGFQSWIHAHGISTLAAVRELAEVAMTGWGGGTVVGGWLEILPLAERTREHPDLLAAHLFRVLNSICTWPGISEGEEQVLYRPAIRAAMRGRAFDSLLEETLPYMHCRADLRAEYFYLREHDFRLLQPAVTFLRTHLEVASPYFDGVLFRFVYSLPPKLRGSRLLLRTLIERRSRGLARVPYERDDLLPTTNRFVRGAHAWLIRQRNRTNARIAPIFPSLATLAVDYEEWLRSDLRAWAHEILLGPRTLERGIFNPEFLAALWDRMQAGNEPNIVGKLAPIMTYELLLRRLCDRDADACLPLST